MKIFRVLTAIIWIILVLSLGAFLLSEFPAEYPFAAQQHITWWHRFNELFIILFHFFLVYAGIITLVRLNRSESTWGGAIVRNRNLRIAFGISFLGFGLLALVGLLKGIYVVGTSSITLKEFSTSLIYQGYFLLMYGFMGALMLFRSNRSR